MKKQCFNCLEVKKVTDFHAHPGMKDGHLNKCKECVRDYSRKRENELRKDPEWLQKERLRGRKKQCEYNKKYPEKRNAKRSSKKLLKPNSDKHLHHWSYSEKHYMDVIPLSVRDHSTLHRLLIYDQERYMYRCVCSIGCFKSGELLDTKERHIRFWNLILKNNL